MKRAISILLSVLCISATVLFAFLLPPESRAQQNWHASVGGETKDMGKQASSFFPNEIWIHAGDSITWTWKSDILHTLSFLTTGQVYPLGGFQEGCPGFATSPAVVDGSSCVTTPAMAKGQTFTVVFPTAGSFKFECMVHLVMSGVVHVLNPSAPLPHNQEFYDREAATEEAALLANITQTEGTLDIAAENEPMDMDMGSDDSVRLLYGTRHVTAGIGEITSTPGGYQLTSLVRFVNGKITIHVGDTVEWGNNDPLEPHTITFGFGETSPADEFDPTDNVTIDADGALHAVLNSPTEKVNSGFLEQPLEDEPGVPQNPVVDAQFPGINIANVALFNPTRFRATFKAPGTYNYKCLVHDNLGMKGQIIVLP